MFRRGRSKKAGEYKGTVDSDYFSNVELVEGVEDKQTLIPVVLEALAEMLGKLKDSFLAYDSRNITFIEIIVSGSKATVQLDLSQHGPCAHDMGSIYDYALTKSNGKWAVNGPPTVTQGLIE
mmetsp:Transcript_2148/g.5951  ORF Transcript_2148/g.5951 Transcript_2148/m.5951 type:complete len:122 (+) Transcript_2148:57-422(+)|eukprot:CAMPEP_0119124766 /NCGR_PEP_ID=MMETSP1310-20130426/4288_1 /TAXON_ID=464262 /ORGANISM="Genus nov. species nov., Strain RCC2339" /LENGTH=121 /DNA_ID=CAMNT_0007114767 /DNA_START=57 /DNA_END=425 /DNA_ORIENTATION=-